MASLVQKTIKKQLKLIILLRIEVDGENEYRYKDSGTAYSQRGWIFSVITSYSIHYTKLYDDGKLGAKNNKKAVKIDNTFKNWGRWGEWV